MDKGLYRNIQKFVNKVEENFKRKFDADEMFLFQLRRVKNMEWSGRVELHCYYWPDKIEWFVWIDGLCGSNKLTVQGGFNATFVRKINRGINWAGCSD